MSSPYFKTASISESAKFMVADATPISASASISATSSPTSTLSLAPSSTIGPNSCQPSGCTAICSPPCSRDQVCSLATMQSCGQCPPSQCISKATIDLPNTSTTSNISSTTTNVSLIVGLTVGLGGGLLLMVALLFCWRRRQRKQSDKQTLILPTNTSDISGGQPTVSSHTANQDPHTIDSAYNNTEKTPVIPNENKRSTSDQAPDQPITAAAVPTVTTDGGISRSLSLKTKLTQMPTTGIARSSSMRVTRNEMRQKRLSDNPFDDLEDESNIVLRRAVSVKKAQRYPRSGVESVANSVERPKSELTDYQRDSINSIYSAAPAIQVVRAKPMVVRVDSLKGRDGRVTRKTSQRALSSNGSVAPSSQHTSVTNVADSQEQETSVTDTPPSQEQSISVTDTPTALDQTTSVTNVPISQDRPISDRYSKSVITPPTHNSVDTQPTEGEITIYWDNNSKAPETNTSPTEETPGESDKS